MHDRRGRAPVLEAVLACQRGDDENVAARRPDRLAHGKGQARAGSLERADKVGEVIGQPQVVVAEVCDVLTARELEAGIVRARLTAGVLGRFVHRIRESRKDWTTASESSVHASPTTISSQFGYVWRRTDSIA